MYTSGKLEEKALVAYDSMWGSTDKMAHAIADGFLAAGVPVRLMDVKCTHISDVMEEFLDCKYVAMGSPTLNSQMMPPMAELITYMKGLSPKNEGRVGIPFGSYGWAPLGPKSIASELEGVGFELPLGTLACNWIPDQAYLDDLRQKVVDLAK